MDQDPHTRRFRLLLDIARRQGDIMGQKGARRREISLRGVSMESSLFNVVAAIEVMQLCEDSQARNDAG